MTTLPSEPAGTAETEGHERTRAAHLARQVAEGFGAEAAFAEVFRRVLPESPFGSFWDRPAVDAYRAGCARVADALRQAGTFGEPEEWLFYWSRPYTRDEWLDLVLTTGGFTQHPEAIQGELLGGLGAAVEEAGGTFTMSYTTIAATAARKEWSVSGIAGPG